MSTRTRINVAIVVWIIAIVVAACFDRAIAEFVRNNGIAAWMGRHGLLAKILKAPGLYYFTIAAAIVVAFVHQLRWRAGLFVLLATIVSGVNGLIKWIVGRTRPFKLFTVEALDQYHRPRAMPFAFSPFRGGIRGLFHESNLCFPSGHAALAFATAAALAMLWPRAKWPWIAYLVAMCVAAERVAENAHWLSDTVGAAALGVAGVHVIHTLSPVLRGEGWGEGSNAMERVSALDSTAPLPPPPSPEHRGGGENHE